MCSRANFQIQGTGVALITPMDESGQIDLASLEKLVCHVIEQGVEYIVALGTTSEAASLSMDEKKKVLQTIKIANRSRVPVILSVGGSDTFKIIEEAKELRVRDYDAMLSVTPYYVKPSQEGLYMHYKTLAREIQTSIILYNVPGRTAVNLHPKTVRSLAESFQNICAIKEASGSTSQFWELLQGAPQGFRVISGDDATTLPTNFLGGEGAISVIAQAFPKAFSSMVRLAKNRENQKAVAIHRLLYSGIQMIFEEGNPTGIKCMLKELGIIKHHQTRLPLMKASQALERKISRYSSEAIAPEYF